MVNPPKNSTYYSVILYTRIDQWFEEGRGAFTLKQLAEWARIKVTPSMRRRVKHSVDSGGLVAQTVAFGARGSTVIFMLPEMQVQELEQLW